MLLSCHWWLVPSGMEHWAENDSLLSEADVKKNNNTGWAQQQLSQNDKL